MPQTHRKSRRQKRPPITDQRADYEATVGHREPLPYLRWYQSMKWAAGSLFDGPSDGAAGDEDQMRQRW